MKSKFEFLFKKIDLKKEFSQLNWKIILIYLILFISFIILDCFLLNKITILNIFFSFSWVTLFILLIYFSKNKLLTYGFIYVLFLILFVVQHFHKLIMKIPFTFSQLFYSTEGLSYIDYILAKIDCEFIFKFIFLLCLGFINCLIIKRKLNNEKRNYFIIFILIIFIVFFRCEAFVFLGETGKQSSFYISNKEKDIYNAFNEKEKVFQICGFYEYHIKDVYVFIKNNFFSLTNKEKKEIEKYFNENKIKNPKNEYTGIMKDKNLIVILAESIDSWLITEDIMPTVHNMMQNSINFTNRYSPFYGGGRTLNTEYCLNTGVYIPESYLIHTELNNYYGNSLPNVFNNHGYKTISVHFNSGKFYNRNNLHSSFGYSNSYFLKDIYNENYVNDYDIINNEKIYQSMISKNEKFMTFFITYSAHLPYNNLNKLCSDIEDIDSVTCIKKLAKHTDDAIDLLIKKLERDDLLDDTVIAFVSDHYAYGLSDELIFDIKGGNTNEIIEKIPFFIWSRDIDKVKIDKYVDTQDILPTILNLFGMENKNYMGTDVMSDEHKNFVYFKDRTYLGNIDKTTVEKLIRINDLIVKGNYH